MVDGYANKWTDRQPNRQTDRYVDQQSILDEHYTILSSSVAWYVLQSSGRGSDGGGDVVSQSPLTGFCGKQ